MIFCRGLIVGVALGIFIAPPIATGQQAGKTYRVGYLAVPPIPPQSDYWEPFLQGLRELGYAEGKNLVIERRYSEGKNERLPELAGELLQLQVDVIVTFASLATEAARQRTKTTPIVMVSVADPIGAGLIASFAHPTGNITGLSNQFGDLEGKALQLLSEIVPRLSRLAVLYNPDDRLAVLYNPDDRGSALGLTAMEDLARPLKVRVMPVGVRRPEDLDGAFATLARERPDALRVSPTFTFFRDPDRIRIADFALTNRIPTITGGKRFVEQGLLMSHAPSVPDLFRRAATYVDKILKGVKPGDLPVEQPTKFELVINMKTAKVLGLTIPQSVLLRADEVIQ